MKVGIFSIYDSKAEAYMQPFFAQEGVAKREFGNLVMDKGHAIGKHREDYTLFYMGSWNESTGVIDGINPRSICNGLDLGNKIEE